MKSKAFRKLRHYESTGFTGVLQRQSKKGTFLQNEFSSPQPLPKSKVQFLDHPKTDPSQGLWSRLLTEKLIPGNTCLGVGKVKREKVITKYRDVHVNAEKPCGTQVSSVPWRLRAAILLYGCPQALQVHQHQAPLVSGRSFRQRSREVLR